MCRFCEDLIKSKELNIDFEYFLHDYFAKLKRNVYKNGQYIGTFIADSHLFNYCPECGRKVVNINNDVKTSN